jgi:hypothetical protein
VITGLLLAPAVAVAATPSPPGAASGGVAPGEASGGPPSVTHAQAATATVTATGGGLTLTTTESTLQGRPLRFQGTTPSSEAGATIVIERRAAGSSAAWIPTASSMVTSAGSFSATWRTSQSGRLSILARVEPAGAAGNATPATPSATTASAAAPNLTITVLPAQLASWYGPGLFGRRTACGERLRRTTLGVASRTLRCGTLVDLVYRGRSLTVPVIDRGPYAPGVKWDLTAATATAIGLTHTNLVGAMAVAGR